MDLVLLIGLVAAWLVVILLGLITYQVILQNGRTLVRLEEVESFMAANDDGAASRENVKLLAMGVAAPPISLPDLNGTPRMLSEWRGHRVLLVFVDPACMFSRALLPYLSGFMSDVVPGRPVPVLVSTGRAEDNRAVFDEAGFAGTVLLQSEREIATAYRVDGTPMSYLIEADGAIASKIAAGVQATMILAGEMASVADATATSSVREPAPRRAPGEALPPGETAPVFRLPQLDGGELSLLEYRGKQVMVVFSDPECEPCDEVAPLLEAHYRSHPEAPIVMISRGDAAANRAKVAEFGFSFPVVLQRHWEISREYGMFATPVAFLVDEWGAIASDAAVGPQAIGKLLGQTW